MEAARTAQGDAVLATLGYAPLSRAGRSSRAAGVLLVAAGVVLAFWLGWRLFAPPPVRPLIEPAAAIVPVAPIASAPRGEKPVPPAPAPLAPARRVPDAIPASTGSAVPTSPSVAAPASLPAAPRVRVPRAPAVSPVTRTEPPAPVAAVRPAAKAEDLDLALYYHRAGDFENALLHYRAVLKTSELNAQVHNNLGLLYLDKNLLDDSARAFQRALLIAPRYARGHSNYGVTLLRQGHLDAAAAEFRTALALEPRTVDAMINLALAEKAGGQIGRARDSLLRALSIEPRNAAAHYNLAVLYDDTNEVSRAVEHYRAFLDQAGAEYANRAPDVRARLTLLATSR